MIPSPTQGVWYLGPLPVRAYALCILMGILIAVQLGERRWMQRGGRPGAVLDIAAWAVPFGIVGGRLYHVATSWQPYFGSGGDPVRALYIWEGGLGIWGAVALGGLGAWIGARRAGVLLPPMADALAPGIVLAQAIGRWGNWFNNELYGSRTSVPWGLQIHQWDQAAGHAAAGQDGKPIVLGTVHPTFLYESLWDCGVAAALVWADRKGRLGHGRVFGLYVVLYTLGRGWIEALRVDPANHILGLRLNLWTCLIVGVGALLLMLLSARRHPGRERSVIRGAAAAAAAAAAPDAGEPGSGAPLLDEDDGGEDDGGEDDGGEDDGDGGDREQRMSPVTPAKGVEKPETADAPAHAVALAGEPEAASPEAATPEAAQP
jgi:prolipoprotein diacylglyceryl transferase